MSTNNKQTNTPSGPKARKAFEESLVKKYGAGKRVAGIPITGGVAYFRRATVEEWEEMQSLRENPDGTTNRSAYHRLVQQVYVGAWVNDELSQLTLQEIAETEGPAFIGGPCGAIVNKLAGTGERQATFLG